MAGTSSAPPASRRGRLEAGARGGSPSRPPTAARGAGKHTTPAAPAAPAPARCRRRRRDTPPQHHGAPPREWSPLATEQPPQPQPAYPGQQSFQDVPEPAVDGVPEPIEEGGERGPLLRADD